MWKKVLYIGVAAVIGIMVFLLGYQSNQINNLTSLVNNAIDSGKYEEVAKIWEGCFDTKSIVVDNDDDLDIVVYPATSQVDVSYGASDDKKERHYKYEKSYYIYIFKSKFNYINAQSSTGEDSNKMGIRFYSGEEKYDYYFVVNADINSSSYVEKPTKLSEALLNNSRDYTASQEGWNFMKLTVTESMLTAMALNGGVDRIAITDNSGAEVYNEAAQLDFSQAFFTDIADLFTNYNEFLQAEIDANGDSKKINAAVEKFNNFYEPWYEDFEAKTAETGYTFRYSEDYLFPSSLIWQTIGMEAIYIVVVAIFYILLFHFAAIRSLFSKERYKDYGARKTYVTPKDDVKTKKAEVVEAEFVEKGESKADKEEVDETPSLEEPKEETKENN